MSTDYFDLEKIPDKFKKFHSEKDLNTRGYIGIKIFQSVKDLEVDFNMVNWYHDFEKSQTLGTFNPKTKHIRINYSIGIYSQLCVFLHELGHAFYYTSKQDTYKEITEYLKKDSSTYNHIERMADVLGYTILQNISGEYKLKELYQRTFLKKKLKNE